MRKLILPIERVGKRNKGAERNILKLTGVHWLAELNNTNEYKKIKKKIQNVTRETQQGYKKPMYIQ